MLKRRILVVTTILLGCSLYYFVFRASSARELNIVNFPWDKVSAFEVSDRGIFGNKILKITNLYSVSHICNMIRKSTRIKFADVNFKSSLGLCTIKVFYSDGSSDDLELTRTSFSGGVLSSGDYYYRNDDLLKEIMSRLKSGSK